MAMTESLASDVLEPSKCGPCLEDNKDNEAVMFCVECNNMLCDACVGIHKRFSTMKTHKIVVQSDKKRFELMAEIMSDKCKQHHGKHLETYCQDHGELCCSVCVSLNHRLCKGIFYLPDYVKEKKNKEFSTEVFESLKGLTGKFNELRSTLANDKEALKEDTCQILKTLDDERDQLIAELNQLHASVRQEIVSHHDAVEVTIDNDQATCDTESRTLSSVIDSLEVWKNDEVRTYIGMSRIKDMTNEASKKLETVKCYAGRRTVMGEDESRLKNRLKESNVLLCSNTLRQSRQKDTSDVKVSTHSLAFGKKVREQQFGNTDMLNINTMRDGGLIASDFDNNILIINKNMNVVEKIPLQYNVQSVCMMENNKVCISFKYQYEIHIATVSGGTLKTNRIIRTGKKCRGVCFITDKLYAACGGRNAGLRVYSKEGRFIREYNNDQNGQKLFSSPYAVTTTSDSSTIFVADKDKGAIALSADGTWLWTYSDTNVVSGIRGIARDDKGDIYVCGIISNNIVKISGDGKLIEEVLNGIIKPKGICYDGENETFTVLNAENTISVYQAIKRIQ